MERSSRASTRRRGLPLAIVLGAALQLAHAPQAFAAIAFVKNVGFLADNTTGTTSSVTVPAGGVAFGHTVLVSLAIDPVAGAVSCTDTQGNSYSVVIDFSNGSGTTGVRSVVFSARIVTALVPGNTITVTHPSVDVRAVSMNEFSGIGFVDRTHTAAGINVTPSSGSTAVTSQANELLLGSIGVETKKDDPFAAGAGYTGLPNIGTGTSGPSDSNVSIDPEYRIVAAISSYFADGSINPAQNWAATIATFPAAVCGNGVVEATEACDDGNLVNGDCCSSACAIEAAGTVCRASAGVCDVQETCTGSSVTCPNDAKSTAVCRASAGICDVAESCDGVGNNCPADGFVAAGTTCRAAAGVCDVDEKCTGSSASCPNDVKSTAVCRAAAGVCDVDDSCDGVADDCPADAVATASTPCRLAAGICDLEEDCDGTSVDCPADAKSTAVCRAAAGICDVDETCDGVADDCPADTLVSAGTPCRAAAGGCDLAEDCDGASAACPADAKSTAVCRPAAGICDVAESCDGVSNACPADGFVAAGTVCRPVAGACDLAESCDAARAGCPSDFKTRAVCRPVAGECDVAENCDGVGDDCPPDALVAAGIVCRGASTSCDLPEVCTGSDASCPADTGKPDTDGDGVCDALDDCPTTADATQSDGDGDGIGDACDPCTNIVPVFAVKPRMRFSRLNVPGREKMRFKGTITVPVSPAIDPSTKGVRVLIDDADGSSMLDAIVPGGFDATTGVGWKRNKRNTAWRYRNPTGFESIVKIRIRGKRKTPGSLKFVVIGQNGTYPMSPTRMPGRGTMVIDSPFATTGQCGGALFSVAPAPSCAFKAHGRTLVCK